MKSVLTFLILSFSISAFAELPEFCKPRVEEVAKEYKTHKNLVCDEENTTADQLLLEMKRDDIKNLAKECEMEIQLGRKVPHDFHLATDVYSVDFAQEAVTYFESLITKQD